MQHSNKRRRFKPTGNPGGSKKGKPQKSWPLFFLMVSDALFLQYSGTRDGMLNDRKYIPLKSFYQHIVKLLPGVESWCAANRPPTDTPWYQLLHNRAYKGFCYSGSSDRGFGHDPLTRGTPSKEFWMKKPHPVKFEELHERIIRGEITHILTWRSYL